MHVLGPACMLFFMNLGRVCHVRHNCVMAPIESWYVESWEGLVRVAWKPVAMDLLITMDTIKLE